VHSLIQCSDMPNSKANTLEWWNDAFPEHVKYLYILRIKYTQVTQVKVNCFKHRATTNS